jgi:autoinducer 2-degrading protein
MTLIVIKGETPMYVVAVDFVIHPDKVSEFRTAMLWNALQSETLEPGCQQFDVCQSAQNPTQFFLYELYDNEAAFEAHLASAHYQVFNAQVGSWVADKQVKKLTLLAKGAATGH